MYHESKVSLSPRAQPMISKKAAAIDCFMGTIFTSMRMHQDVSAPHSFGCDDREIYLTKLLQKSLKRKEIRVLVRKLLGADAEGEKAKTSMYNKDTLKEVSEFSASLQTFEVSV